MWQLISRPPPTSASGGSTSSQIAPSLRGQRVWKTQPEGGFAADGMSPESLMRVCAGSVEGTAESSASVYGWCGASNTSCAVPSSIRRPR